MEKHGPLTLIALIENRFDFHLDDANESVIATREVERGEFLIKGEYRETDNEFLRWTKTIYNFVLKDTDQDLLELC